jgi:cytochrome P450
MSVDLCAKRRFAWSERPDDLAMPRPPAPSYFDHVKSAWVLSRYADVLAALHDARLQPVSYEKADTAKADDEMRSSIRSETHRGLSLTQLFEWQQKIEPLARRRMASLAVDRPVDLVGEFAEPWCATVAIIVTGAAARNCERLIELARRVSAAAADPDDPGLKVAAAAADSELQRLIPSGTIPMAGAAFVALAQTLPGFLANAWLALLRHPSELYRLSRNPDLMPAAMEELLRYAGLARSITRFAQEPVDLRGALVRAGQKVSLALNSANRDPEQFTEPNRLDLTRRAVKHLALGAGPHSCAGSALIRMISAVATKAFVQRFHAAAVCEPVEWRGGAVFRAPAVLLARSHKPSCTSNEYSA